MAYHRWNWRDENEFYPSSVLKMQTVCLNSGYESYPVCQFYDFNVFNIKKKNASCGLAPENTDFLNLCFDTMF